MGTPRDARRQHTVLGRPVAVLLEDLADASPTPGAGSAAALTTALAAALLAMAARASRGSWDDSGAIVAQADALRARAAGLVDRNATAYADVLELLARTEGEPDDRRDSRLGEALARAAAVPLEIAETAADVADLGVLVVDRADPSVTADAAAAVLLADSAARAAAHLVRVNLTAQPGDDRIVHAEELLLATASAARRVTGDP